VEAAPRAYKLKASNAAPPISTMTGTSRHINGGALLSNLIKDALSVDFEQNHRGGQAATKYIAIRNDYQCPSHLGTLLSEALAFISLN
jgi:hypothetical protein